MWFFRQNLLISVAAFAGEARCRCPICRLHGTRPLHKNGKRPVQLQLQMHCRMPFARNCSTASSQARGKLSRQWSSCRAGFSLPSSSAGATTRPIHSAESFRVESLRVCPSGCGSLYMGTTSEKSSARQPVPPLTFSSSSGQAATVSTRAATFRIWSPSLCLVAFVVF